MPNTHKFPKFGLTMDEMFVRDEQFVHKSELHGQGHVNRVIWWAMQLTKAYGLEEEIGRLVWAAAYLHDLSRRHDGPCTMHGEWAVKEQLPKYRELFRKAGIKLKDEARIIVAVIDHCRNREHEDMVCIILKDADAIDRVRLGDLNFSMLRLHERSPVFARQYAQDLLDETPLGTGEQVVQAGLKRCFEHRGLHDKYQRGEIRDAVVESWITKTRDARLRFIAAYKKTNIVSEQIAHLFSNIVTPVGHGTGRCRILAFSRRSPPNLTFWEFFDKGPELFEKTWHWKFSDSPEDARLYNDLRLYGVRAYKTKYGVFGSVDWLKDGALARLREMYGGWVAWCNPNAPVTFTIDDSQTANIVWPFNQSTTDTPNDEGDYWSIPSITCIYRFYCLVHLHSYMVTELGVPNISDDFMKKMCSHPLPPHLAKALAPKFIEVQMHNGNNLGIRSLWGPDAPTDGILRDLANDN